MKMTKNNRGGVLKPRFKCGFSQNGTEGRCRV